MLTREEILACSSNEELAWTIILHSIDIENADKIEDVKEGLYLSYRINKFNNKKGFDTYFRNSLLRYNNVIQPQEHQKEDFYEDAKILAFEVLLDYLNNVRITLNYQPKNIIDFCNNIYFNTSANNNVTAQLVGIVGRRASNLLYCTKDRNSINPYKMYYHLHKGAKERGSRKFWVDYRNNLELDSTDFYGKSNIVFFDKEVKRLNLNDDEAYVDNVFTQMKKIYLNNKSNSIEDLQEDLEYYKYGVSNLVKSKIFIDYRNNSYLNNSIIFNVKDVNKNKKEIIYKDIIDIKYDNYLNFYGILFRENRLDIKFDTIRYNIRLVNRFADMLDNILLENLSLENYSRIWYYMENYELSKYYIKTKYFREVIDILLEEGELRQKKFKDIYVYNENERISRIKEVYEYYDTLVKIDNSNNRRYIKIADMSKLFKKYYVCCKIENYEYGKTYFTKIDKKLEALKTIGIDFSIEKTDNGVKRYYIKDWDKREYGVNMKYMA